MQGITPTAIASEQVAVYRLCSIHLREPLSDEMRASSKSEIRGHVVLQPLDRRGCIPARPEVERVGPVLALIDFGELLDATAKLLLCLAHNTRHARDLPNHAAHHLITALWNPGGEALRRRHVRRMWRERPEGALLTVPADDDLQLSRCSLGKRVQRLLCEVLSVDDRNGQRAQRTPTWQLEEARRGRIGRRVEVRRMRPRATDAPARAAGVAELEGACELGLEYPVQRKGLKVLQRIRGSSSDLRELIGDLAHLDPVDGEGAGTLDDRPPEQAACSRRCTHTEAPVSPSRCTHDRHIVGIAPKSRNLSAYPLECCHLVPQTAIRVATSWPQEAEHSKAVIACDDDEPALCVELATSSLGSVDQDKHRVPRVRPVRNCGGGCPNARVQAVLRGCDASLALLCREPLHRPSPAGCSRSLRRAVQHTRPRLGRFGPSPPQTANRWRCKGNTPEVSNPGTVLSDYPPCRQGGRDAGALQRCSLRLRCRSAATRAWD
mmetsp:Transcript_117771/g.263098  ORF Transcript_117771/g.263098 Transcript_117771/m.263098 type:complete len:493 (-) Transcript_117771:126-1604(-)